MLERVADQGRAGQPTTRAPHGSGTSRSRRRDVEQEALLTMVIAVKVTLVPTRLHVDDRAEPGLSLPERSPVPRGGSDPPSGHRQHHDVRGRS